MDILEKQSFKVRSVLLLFIAGLSVWFFIMVMGRYAMRPKAGVTDVTVEFDPGTATIGINGTTTINMSLIAPLNQNILGIDTTFDIVGPVSITQTQPLQSSVIGTSFTSLLKNGTRFAYTTASNGGLPNVVTMPLDVTCTGIGQATVSINSTTSQIIGSNMPGTSYEINAKNTLSVSCGGVGTFATGAPLTLKINTRENNIAVNQPTDVEVVLQPDDTSSKISAFSIELQVNPADIEIVDVLPPIVVPIEQPPIDPPEDGSNPPGNGTSPNVTRSPIDTQSFQTYQTLGGSCTVDADCLAACVTCTTGKCVNGTCEYPSSNQPNPTAGGGGGGGTTNPGVPMPTGNNTDPVPPPEDVPSNDMEELIREFDTTTGTIKLAYIYPGGDSSIPNKVSIHMILKGKKEGELPINVVKSVVSGNVEGDEYDVTTTDGKLIVGNRRAPTGGPNAGSPIGSPVAMTIHLKLHFQGISVKPSRVSSIPVRIGIDHDAFQAPEYASGTFTANETGVWSGNVTINVPIGDGYRILVKGPYHLQKRFCDEEPSDNEDEGSYNCARGNISLVAGEQTFDFLDVANLVGDLPDQDGIFNSKDIVQCRKSIGETSEEALRLADINMDGGVNGLDCSLILASANKRHDEK